MHCINREITISIYFFSVGMEKNRECCLPLLIYGFSLPHSNVNEGAVDVATWGNWLQKCTSKMLMWRHLGDSHSSLSHHGQILHFFMWYFWFRISESLHRHFLFHSISFLIKKKSQGLPFVIPVSSYNFEAFLLPSSLQFRVCQQHCTTH